MNINVDLLRWFIHFLITCAWSEILAMQNIFAGGDAKTEINPNQQLAEELHKPIIRKSEK